MWSLGQRNGSHRLHLGKKEVALLNEHGLSPDGARYVSIVLGYGRQTRKDIQMKEADKGYMRPIDVVECEHCRERTKLSTVLGGFGIGSHVEWYEGKSVVEKHWHMDDSDPQRTIGLRLKCLYSVYIDILQHGKLAYCGGGDPTESSRLKDGRVALVSAALGDILSVEDERLIGAALEPEPRMHGGIIVKVSKLKVIDLVDEINLVPNESLLLTILNASAEWHCKWHRLVDAIRPTKWHDFPAKMVTTLQLAGL